MLKVIILLEDPQIRSELRNILTDLTEVEEISELENGHQLIAVLKDPNQVKNSIKRIQALRRALAGYGQKCPLNTGANKSKIAIQTNNRFIFIDMKDIVLITRHERKTVIFTTHGVVKTNEPMRKLEQRLSSDDFFRCHKGYIVNSQMVTELALWGNKTYLVKLAHTNETALTTIDKAKEFRQKYCSE